MFPNVIRPTRGLDSNVCTEFTAADLEAIAPLEHGDAREMGELCCPSPEAIERMNARIRAAKKLKYGRAE